MAKLYHPDKNKGNKIAQDKFIEITNAYETLSDIKKRKEYDHEPKFGDVNHFGQHTTNQRQQHHQQFPPDDDDYIVFQMPDGRIFRQRRGPPQHPFRSHHQQQQQHNHQQGFHFHFHEQSQQQQSFFQFDFDNIDDWDRHRSPGLWGSIVYYLRYFLHLALLLLYVLFVFVMGLHHVSPLAAILLMVGVVMCCLPNRWLNDDEPIRHRSTTPIPPPPPPPPVTLDQLRETDMASKNCICVIAVTPKASRHLLVLQNRYRKDPMRFCVSLITENIDYDVIATSKGGERWTGLTFEKYNETQLTVSVKAINLRDSTDMWLLNLLGGTVSWRITSDDPLPITVNSSPRT